MFCAEFFHETLMIDTFGSELMKYVNINRLSLSRHEPIYLPVGESAVIVNVKERSVYFS